MATFSTIDRDALDTVTGGTSKADQQQRILDKITSMVGAVADVAAQQQQPNNGGAAAAMPLVALKAMRQRQL